MHASVDIAGVMTGIEGERKYAEDDKLIDMLVIHIENDSLKLNVAVLGKMVDWIKVFVYCRETLQYLSVLSDKLAYVAEDEVLYSTETKIIKELRVAMDVRFYVVLAIILDVEPVPSWWYKSCVCSMKAEVNVDTYFCDGCNKDVNNVVDKYDSNWTYLCNLFIKSNVVM
ncbi:hypothetical protein Ahy_B09g098879 [Arachis hypogaea]|uniref:Replication factor A C-terminal domain-containing protein n=1 Tax=Arachis hypogaea TaxID=3818 RepID=A0A444XT72_ARAHY|nr:hypothetical protein Ahy_B09g098879 [Arachis hypogaea]